MDSLGGFRFCGFENSLDEEQFSEDIAIKVWNSGEVVAIFGIA